VALASSWPWHCFPVCFHLSTLCPGLIESLSTWAVHGAFFRAKGARLGPFSVLLFLHLSAPSFLEFTTTGQQRPTCMWMRRLTACRRREKVVALPPSKRCQLFGFLEAQKLPTVWRCKCRSDIRILLPISRFRNRLLRCVTDFRTISVYVNS